jgi:CubicO group peptidase (beta-lactamase class C family)
MFPNACRLLAELFAYSAVHQTLRDKASRSASELELSSNNSMRFVINPRNRCRFGGALVSLVICLFSLCFQSASAEPLSSDLQTTIERLARDKHVCAVAYATIHAGKITSSGGASGCAGGRNPSGDFVFQAASLSKPVFAYAILKLAQEGLLNIDAPLVSYLPHGYLHIQTPFAFGKPPISDRVVVPEIQAVTARMVLSHTSGLPDWSSDSLVFDFKPGTVWQYSGEGFMLLQRVAESITNKGLDDFMRDRVFDPLGMSDTAFRWKPQFADVFIPGMPKYMEIPEALAPFSLHTTAKDYAKFLGALMADQQVMQLIVQSPATVLPKLGLEWGLGWGVERGERETFLWHWGNNPGYRAFVMASTSSGNAVVMLTNSEEGLAMAEPIIAKVLPGTHNVFKSYLVREGFSYFACKNLDWCK